MAANPSIQLGTDGNWAIKEDNLLAYKKDGTRFFNKEFDFTRGSFATFVDKDGLIKVSGLQETNLVNNGDFSELGSELVTNGNFDTDSDWTKGTGWTISGGTGNASATFDNLGQTGYSFVINKTYKVTYEVKNYVNGNMRFQLTGGATLNGNTVNSNGIYTQYVKATANHTNFRFRGTNFTGSIDNVSVKQVDPNDYWTITNNTGTDTIIKDGYAEIKTDGAYTQIEQTNVTISSKTYKLQYTVLESDEGDLGLVVTGNTTVSIPNTVGTHDFYFVAHSTSFVLKRRGGALDISITNISVQEVQADTPRIDFTDDATGHLLLEPQRTNSVVHSEYLGTWWFKYRCTTLDNQGISPEGLNNAARITSTAIGSCVIYRTGMVCGSLSMFAKPDNITTGKIKISVDGVGSATWNADGTLDLVSGGTAVDGKDYGNGWFRFAFNVTSGSVVNYGMSAGAIGENMLIYGIQNEPSASYPTSYIPTYGSTATRNADVCNNSGSAQDFNSEEGVLYCEIQALANDTTARRLSISDGNINNVVEIGFTNVNNEIKNRIKSGGSTTVNLNYTATNVLNYNKIAFKFKVNDFAVFANGQQVLTDTSGAVPTELTNISFNRGDATQDFYGKVRELKVFKRAMSDGELYLLTVTQYQSYQEMATALNYTL